MNWTYVSLVNSPDAYGDGASSDVQNVLRTNPNYSICLAMIVRIPPSPTAQDYDTVVDTLAANKEARVVMVYLSQTVQPDFFQAVRRRVGFGRFVFIGGDALSDNANLPFADMLVGSVFTNLPSAPVPGLQQYMWSLKYGSVSCRVLNCIHAVADAEICLHFVETLFTLNGRNAIRTNYDKK